LRILVSAAAAASHGAAIRAAAPGAELVPVPPEGPLPDTAGVEIGFLTRDLFERGTRDRLAPEILRFTDLLRETPSLRWAHIYAAGSDMRLFRELAARPGVVVTTSAGASAPAMAQSALAGILALTRQLPVLAEAQRRHAWEPLYRKPPLPRDLAGQRALVLGTGPIGQAIGRYCRGFDMLTTGIRRDPSAGLPPGFDAVAGFEAMPDLLPATDWLVLACPLTETTRNLVDAGALALLPRGAGLVNVARGGIVVEADLLAALRSGQLSGAFLDVFSEEPLAPESPFWDLPNVIVCPHSAAAFDGLAKGVETIFCDNLRRWQSGERLRNIVEG
jgi:phosphoglycerate dehydrogenase-like enzyme